MDPPKKKQRIINQTQQQPAAAMVTQPKNTKKNHLVAKKKAIEAEIRQLVAKQREIEAEIRPLSSAKAASASSARLKKSPHANKPRVAANKDPIQVKKKKSTESKNNGGPLGPIAEVATRKTRPSSSSSSKRNTEEPTTTGPLNDDSITVELQKKNLNVSAGRVFYERASSRHSRTRLALMKHSEASRDKAVPLQRGGARGPGSTMLVGSAYNHGGDEADLLAPILAKPQRISSRSHSLMTKESYAALMPNHIMMPPSETSMKRARSDTTTTTLSSSSGSKGSSRSRLFDKLAKKN